MSLAGKTCVVVGASSPGGIGEAIARRFCRDGANVTIAGRRDCSSMAAAMNDGAMNASATNAHATKVRASQCDVTDEGSVEALFEDLGQIDVAVNAAGSAHFSPLKELDLAKARPLIETQLIGGLTLLKHACRHVTDGGSIVALSSLTVSNATRGQALYSATKAAIDQAVRVAALEVGARGVRVNSVAPGLVRTSMTEALFAAPHMERVFAGETAMKRLATREDVAATVAWLADDNNFITGEVIPVSGGAQLLRTPSPEELAGRS